MTSDLVASPPAVRGAEGRLVADRPGEVDPRVELAQLLQVAAAIEHSLMVQYLYAAYSADVVIAAGTFPDAALWQQQLLTVAREEMGHLMTVQNALRLIGAAPNWKREDIPWDGPYYPFPMEFEPFTFIAIEKYVYAEMDPSIDATPPPGRKISPQRKQWEVLRLKIDADVKRATKTEPHHVGKLFHDLLARLRDPTLTDERWFDPATYVQQASWDAWGKGYRPHPLDADLDDPRQPPNVIVAQMGTRTEAIDGLMQIAGQGEAPHLRHPRTRTPSHFDRFMAVYDGLEPVATQVDALVKNLPVNPTTQQQFADATGCRRAPAAVHLEHSVTRPRRAQRPALPNARDQPRPLTHRRGVDGCCPTRDRRIPDAARVRRHVQRQDVGRPAVPVAAHRQADRPPPRRATVRSAGLARDRRSQPSPDVGTATRAHADIGEVLRPPAQRCRRTAGRIGAIPAHARRPRSQRHRSDQAHPRRHARRGNGALT